MGGVPAMSRAQFGQQRRFLVTRTHFAFRNNGSPCDSSIARVAALVEHHRVARAVE